MDHLSGSVWIDQGKNGGFEAMFLPIILGGLKEVPVESIKRIGAVYEYLDKALPRAVNGKPCFHSCRFLHRDDLPALVQHIERYQAERRMESNGPTA